VNIAVLVLRILLILICIETAARYTFWWSKTRHDYSAGLLPPLMIGIGMVQLGTFLRNFNFFSHTLDRMPLMDVVIVPDALIMAGTLVHLIPCWRISYGFSDQRIAMEIVGRTLAATVIAAALMIMHLV